MASRKLVVEIVGDSRSLERAFSRSASKGKEFQTSMTGVTRSLTGLQRGLLAGTAVGSVTIGLRDVIGVAAESQQVLGQTKVALESTGRSWVLYSDQIQKAVQAQSQLGFDDEALLQSFSLFIRTSDSVGEALRRNQIAMDISRARFIDYASAANIVNKAALGQAGALRRIGIDARTGASSVELLAQLEREFGGAAAAASDDATTAMDRLNVSAENAKESLGTLALPVVSNLADVLSEAADASEKLTDALGGLEQKSSRLSLGDLFAPITDLPSIVRKSFTPPWKWGDIDKAEQAAKSARKAMGDIEAVRRQRGAEEQPGAPAGPGGVTAKQRNQWWDAMIGRREDRVQDIRSLQGQLAELRAIAKLIQARIKVTKDITRQHTLEDQLLAVQRQQRSITEQMQANTKELQAQQAEAAKQARLARQFRVLGLGPTGAEVIPGAKNLRKQLESLDKRVAGGRDQGVLDRIRKLLFGDEKLLPEVRSRIQEMFRAIRDELNKGTRTLTRQRKVNINQLLAGMGLSPDEMRKLRGRLSRIGPGGTAPAGGSGAFGMAGVGAVIVHHQTVLDGRVVESSVTKRQQTRKRRNPAQKRGPYVVTG